MRDFSFGTVALLLVAAMPATVAAQSRGDALLASGRPFAAESAFYEAARLRPRDPAARLSLGRYLAARGAVRVGAVLMEEARYFGGDPATVAADLAPAYERLGDWKALAALPSPPITAGERARAAWLADHAPSRSGPDQATTAYTVEPGHPLGRVALRVGTVDVLADVDPTARGLVLPPSVSGDPHSGLRAFGPDATRQPAVASAVHAGALSLGNLPVTLDAAARTARVGFDLLGTLAPTFDADGHTVTLRRGGRVPADLQGARIPTFVPREGAFVVLEGMAVGLGTRRGVDALTGARWTWDARRGTVIRR